MSVIDAMRAGSSDFKVPRTEGFLGIITKPLEILDVPGNMTRSFLRYVDTGDTKYLKNVFKTANPFQRGRHISGEELFGVSGFWKGLLAEIVTDPLMLVGGIGSLTKVGTLAKRSKSLQAKLVQQKGLSRAISKLKKTPAVMKEMRTRAQESIGRIKKDLRSVRSELKTARKADPRKRSILKLSIPFGEKKFGAIELGDFNKLTRQYGILSSAERMQAGKSISNIQASMSKRLAKGQPIDKNVRQLAEAQKIFEGSRRGVIGDDASQFVSRHLLSLSNRFSQRARGEVARGIEETVKTADALATDILGVKEAAMVRDLKNLVDGSLAVQQTMIKRLSRFDTEGKLLTRLTRGAEARHILDMPIGEAVTTATKKRDKAYHAVKLDALKKLKKKPEGFKDNIRILSDVADKLHDVRTAFTIDRLKLQQASKNIAALSIDELRFIETHTTILEGLVETEQLWGIPITPIIAEKDLLSYTERIRTPKGRAWGKRNKKQADILHASMGDLSARMSSQNQRTVFPDMEIYKVNQELRAKHGLDFDVYSLNLVDSLILRKQEHFKAVHRAIGAHTAVEIFGKTFAEGVKPGPGWVSAKSFAAQVGLKKDVFKGKYIPKSVVDDLIRNDQLIQRSLTNIEEIAWIFPFMDTITAPFRALVTSPFPAFHVRNFIGNVHNNMVAGMSPAASIKYGFKASRLQGLARQRELGKVLSAADEAIIRELSEFRALGTGHFWAEMDSTWASNVTRRFTSSIIDIESGLLNPKAMGAEWARKVDQGFFTRTEKLVSERPARFDNRFSLSGTNFGSMVEQNARISHYLWRRDLGDLPHEAMRSMNKYLFDYSALTPFERKKVRPLFLFYTWNRNNIPLMFQTAFTKPRMAAVYNNLVSISDGEIPQYLRGGSAFPSPFGGNTFVGSLGLPIEDLNKFSVRDADPVAGKQIPRLLSKMVAQMNPLIQTAYTLATGKVAFTQRDITTLSGIEKFQALNPFGRFVRAGKIAVDPNRSATMKLVDFISGFKVYPVKPTRGAYDEAKRRAVGTGLFDRVGFLVLPKPGKKDDPIVKRIQRDMRKLAKKLKAEKKRG